MARRGPGLFDDAEVGRRIRRHGVHDRIAHVARARLHLLGDGRLRSVPVREPRLVRKTLRLLEQGHRHHAGRAQPVVPVARRRMTVLPVIRVERFRHQVAHVAMDMTGDDGLVGRATVVVVEPDRDLRRERFAARHAGGGRAHRGVAIFDVHTQAQRTGFDQRVGAGVDQLVTVVIERNGRGRPRKVDELLHG